MPLLILGIKNKLLLQYCNEVKSKNPLTIHTITSLSPLPMYAVISDQGNNCIEITTKMLYKQESINRGFLVQTIACILLYHGYKGCS